MVSELSALPSFFSLTTKVLTIENPAVKLLTLNTIAAKTNTDTRGSDRVGSTVAQAHRSLFQPQCHLPREAVNHSSDMCVLGVPPVPACRSPCLAEDPLRGSWLTWGSLSLSPLLSHPLRRWLHCLGWQFQATADNHYLWWYHGNSQPVFTDMGRYSLSPQSSSGPGAPDSHQWGGCFALTVTLYICNSLESLASVPNSPGILVF